ncbi:DUF6879 family protein [Streptomyces sp. NPDC090025]|uniref:DUF6879 family protein n=1 Tax=Streptomyces sp. NPDC090025 TaxID=3365922 RepID=UPI0038326DAA
MPQFIDDSAFGAFFADFEHTAWRLETRSGYGSDREGPKYRHFQETGTVPDEPERPWCANVRRQTAEGKRFERVRVVDQPPTTEQLYLLASAATNNDAERIVRFCQVRDAAWHHAIRRVDFTAQVAVRT